LTAVAPCWICGGGAAETREHRSKASDLRSLFGTPTQADPLYFHTAKRKNFRVGSLKADVLKFSHRICIQCNAARTQPHDRAWAVLSETLRSRQPPIVGPVTEARHFGDGRGFAGGPRADTQNAARAGPCG